MQATYCPKRAAHLGGAGGQVMGSLFEGPGKGWLEPEAGLFICFLKSVPEIVEGLEGVEVHSGNAWAAM